MKQYKLFLVIGFLLLLAGCASTYYNTLEKFGVHKRDIMVSRITAARDAQAEAKEQFVSALDQFRSVVNVDGGDLEKTYKTLNRSYEACLAKAEEVHKRIAKVESVAEALFDEWEAELGQYTSAELRRDSAEKLRQTKEQYEQLLLAMKKAESRIKPVLSLFHDQVLYLKHNLNARAISSLRGELVTIEQNVDSLVREMEASIAEANRFIASLQ